MHRAISKSWLDRAGTIGAPVRAPMRMCRHLTSQDGGDTASQLTYC